MLIYKVLTAAQWADLQAGTFKGAAVDVADGFVHLSSAAQLDETLARHFAGQTGLVVAQVDAARLGEALVWEASSGGMRGGALFPHLYGRLTMAAVVGWEALG